MFPDPTILLFISIKEIYFYIHTYIYRKSAMMIEEFFQHLSIRTIGTLVVALLAIRFITRWIIKEQKIKALGGHCPKVKYYIPFGKWSILLSQTRKRYLTLSYQELIW